MLNYKTIENFFENNPQGYINIVQYDKEFKLTSLVGFILDENSITLMGIYWSDKIYGNVYIKKGNFMIPFNQIIRIEYIKEEKEG